MANSFERLAEFYNQCNSQEDGRFCEGPDGPGRVRDEGTEDLGEKGTVDKPKKKKEGLLKRVKRALGGDDKSSESTDSDHGEGVSGRKKLLVKWQKEVEDLRSKLDATEDKFDRKELEKKIDRKTADIAYQEKKIKQEEGTYFEPGSK